MSPTDFFKRLGAPLVNPRWSWGSIRGSDGAVFLRVWQDRLIKIEGSDFMMVTHHEKYEGKPDSPGYRERLDHVAKIKNGATCYMVMCRAKDPSASPRKIEGFNQREVFVGGRVLDLDNDTWVELKQRVPVESVCQTR